MAAESWGEKDICTKGVYEAYEMAAPSSKASNIKSINVGYSRKKDEEGASNTRERENEGLEGTANANATSRPAESHAAATATKPAAVTQLSDDDDAAVKSFDGVIGKNNK
ncbi:hypothetical protein AWC38_SpisGene22975 [Stylophora pistillata]|uniref:Uncharacterized protein n=1 Tax=Stylophora pistillata TaxID=50429 RepID=A0A2B4R9C0_STYPI|nr:hypothetical protein AWC38_SpisGene22975 [Stylophora pistillata]